MDNAPVVHIRLANIQDAIDIAPLLRGADRREIELVELDTIDQVLMQSILESPDFCWAGFINGQMAALFGVGPCGDDQPGVGVPWMVGTDILTRYPKIFLQTCRPYVEQMKGSYPMLANMVHAENEKSIRWLEWLGFQVHKAIPHGLHDEPFHPFTWMREA